MHKHETSMCWLNGEIMPTSQARIPVMDHAILYGDGVFEGIRFYNGCAFRLQAHLERLQDSATAIQLALPCNLNAMTKAVEELVAACGFRDGYLRLVVTRGEGPMGLDPAPCREGNMFIIATQLSLVSAEKRRQGIRAIIAATRRLTPDGLDPRIKSLNYINHILARIEANNAQAEEAILLNGSGNVAEGTADNVFIVKKGVLLTPPVTDGALDGITRGIIIDLAKALAVACQEKTIAPYDLYTADECFLTGTGAELIPVGEVNGRALRQCPGPLYTRLQQQYAELIERETSGQWL